MTEFDIGNLATTDLTSAVPDFAVSQQTTDGVSGIGETRWHYNEKWSKYLGYYKEIPELKKAIDALAIWTLSQGFETDSATQAKLDNITGMGKDTFQTILWNMIVVKKLGGDAFAEIIRNSETGTLINLKPLDPSSMVGVVGEDGLLDRYEQISEVKDQANRPLALNKVLHLVNDRVADEVHGTAVPEVCQFVIDARNEAMSDWKKILHRNMHFRWMEIDTDDTSKINTIKTQYAEAIEKGELLILPRGTAEMKDIPPSVINPIDWIRYLENFFYITVGIPRVMVSSEGQTEAGGKVGFLTFEPTYSNEQVELENDLWNQVAIKIKLNRPPSLGGVMREDEAKNTGQVGFQPNDTNARRGE